MLKYTIAAYHRIVKDLGILANITTIVTQSFMILYLAYALIIGQGNRIINAILLVMTALNLVIHLITNGKRDKKSKTTKKISRTAYIVTKLTLNAVSLASVVYSIYVNSADVTAFAMLTTPLMILLWIAQVAFELIKLYVTNRAALFLDGLKMDFEFVLKPIVKTKNFFKDLFGEEREDTEIVGEKNRRILTEQAGIEMEEKREENKAFWGKLWDVVKRKFFSKKKKKEDPDKLEAPEVTDERPKVTAGVLKAKPQNTDEIDGDGTEALPPHK
ncbi:MAG: hypothetical protein IKC87_00235 [Clostridia bacterium]|nr:hypothetical protein [Clostridia bacterium]